MVTTTFFAMPFTVSAAEATEAPSGATSGTTGDCTWTLDDNGVLTISGNGAMGDYSDYSKAPWRNLEFTEAVIENGVTIIGEYAFENCESLTYVNLPNSITNISSLAFYGCKSLTNITIPDSVTSIGEWAFMYCTSLTSITIPESVTIIGKGAFSFCESLTSITIPYSVTSYLDSPFLGCLSLTRITVDERNPVYDSRDNCNAIIETGTSKLIQGCSNTVIPNSITVIGDDAFALCKNLTNIEIPESVTSIGWGAFRLCSSLTDIIIPESVTSIGIEAFICCESLTSINIPYSVTSIGEFAFESCNILSEITVDERNPKYDSRNNCNAIIETESNTLIQGCNTTVIPYSVTSIGRYAFWGLDSLTEIMIPDNVTYIDNDAFYCPNISTIYGKKGSCAEAYANSNNILFCNIIADGTTGDCKWFIDEHGILTIIGNGAMENYSYDDPAPWKDYEFSTVIINNGVLSIGDYAFLNCSDLRHIIVPNSVDSIGRDSFSGCLNLTINGVENSFTEDYAVLNSITFDALNTFGKTGSCIWILGNDGKLVISGNGAMLDYCYYDTTAPWKFSYPIEDFSYLTEVIIEDGVTSIGEYAFYDCFTITSVSIPDSVTSIGEWAFYWCYSLTDVYYNGTQENWNEISIGNNNEELNSANIHFLASTVCEHIYGEPTWTWDGYSAATATFSCAECDDVQEVPATVTTAITTAPTCTETGIRTCTATVTFNGNTYTDTKEKTVPATGHSYGEPTWTWDGYSSATATFTCADCDDVQVKNAKVTTKITQEPTATETGIRTCTASVTFNGKAYKDTKLKVIPATGQTSDEPGWNEGYSDFDIAPGAVPFYVMGDANSDGVANIKDVTAIQCYLAGIRDLNSIGMMVADVDGDGEVNINDATAIQMYLACFDYTYPIDSIVTYVY